MTWGSARANIESKMDETLKAFLEKFAGLERRVRKLAAEDRGLRDEVRSLRERLVEAGEREDELKALLEEEREIREEASRRVDELIGKLESLDDADAEKGPEQEAEGPTSGSNGGPEEPEEAEEARDES